MVDTSWLLMGVVFVVLLFLVGWFVKRVLKIILLVILAVVFVLGFSGVLVYEDIIDLKENWEGSSKLFLLKHEGELVGGLEGKDLEAADFVPEERMKKYRDYYRAKEKEKILENNYKVFVFKSEVFEGIGELSLKEKSYSEEYVFSLLGREDAWDKFIEDYIEEIGGEAIEEVKDFVKKDLFKKLEVEDEAEFKGLIFGLLLGKLVEEDGFWVLVEEYKKGRIEVYPETGAFKLIKYMPIGLVKGLVERVIEGTKEKIKEKL